MMTSIAKQIEFRENLQEQIVDLRQQLYAADRRIAELDYLMGLASQHRNELEQQIVDEKQRAEAAERKLATARGLFEAIKTYRAYMPDVVYTICDKALAQIEHPQKQLPGEDPPFDACQCLA